MKETQGALDAYDKLPCETASQLPPGQILKDSFY